MANLVELFDNIVQMQNLNGVPLANGKLYVYALGRTRLMDTWSDVDGESLNTNPIILDDAGQAHCFVSDDFDYTLVVKDAYDNEIFSIDKYLYSKGEHSHADVAVAPSEHIGVSSYHVGETTVYVPYIQGELGKTYHGIEPIVVNNQENKISARNIPLGVQSPLYFAEDSESACIIGMSGEYQPITGMSGYATTGDLVDLATSVSETYQPKGDYATHDDLSGFMEESKLETADGKITGYDGTAFAGGGSVDPSEFIPWSASGNFATSGDLNDKLDTTAFSTVSGDFITAIPDTYASKDFVLSSVSSKLDSTAFSTVSGDFITALPEGLLNESGFEYDGDKISAYNGSAFVGQGGGGITGEYELSAGNGISIDNFPIEQKTVISVTGNYATEDWVTGQGYLTAETDWTDTITAASANAYNEATAAIPAPFDPSYLSGQIDTKLDSAIYANDSGTFLTAHQDISDLMPKSESANFYPMTGNPSGFLTAVDLSDYQTISGMTAYQSAGNYATVEDVESATSGVLTANVPSAFKFSANIENTNDFVNINVPGGYTPLISASGHAGGPETISIAAYGFDASSYHGEVHVNEKGLLCKQGATTVQYNTSGAVNSKFISDNAGGFSAIPTPVDYYNTAIPLTKINFTGLTAQSSPGDNSSRAIVDLSDITYERAGSAWSLTGSVQKREIEGDSATSAITAIAGSAISSEVPAGTMNESAFSYDASDNITAYNGSAFKAGDEFPQSATEAIETVTANSADWNGTTETVSSNSGVWGGSALPISAGPGIKVNLVDNTLVFSNDETLLYSAAPKNYGGESSGESITLNESISSFERLRFYINVMKGPNSPVYYESYEVDNYLGTACNFQYGPYPENNVNANWFILRAWATNNICNISAAYNPYTATQDPDWTNKWFPGSLYKIVGINRIAGGN